MNTLISHEVFDPIYDFPSEFCSGSDLRPKVMQRLLGDNKSHSLQLGKEFSVLNNFSHILSGGAHLPMLQCWERDLLCNVIM